MNDDANNLDFLESAIGPNNTDYYLQKFQLICCPSQAENASGLAMNC